MIGRHIPILIPLVLLLGAMLTGIVGARRRRAAYYISLTGLACALVLAVLGLQHVITGETIRYHVGGWPPPIGIEYVCSIRSPHSCWS